MVREGRTSYAWTGMKMECCGRVALNIATLTMAYTHLVKLPGAVYKDSCRALDVLLNHRKEQISLE